MDDESKFSKVVIDSCTNKAFQYSFKSATEDVVIAGLAAWSVQIFS
jgi:hypothetical protein